MLRLGLTGLRTRPTRAVLSALGIAIGIAAMIAVVGISSSSQARLNDELARLGTNLLTATAGTDLRGQQTTLPPDTLGKVRLVDGVEQASGTAKLPAPVYRSPLSDPAATGGITSMVADRELLGVVSGDVRTGAWLNPATSDVPHRRPRQRRRATASASSPREPRSGWAARTSPSSASSTRWRSPRSSTAPRSSARPSRRGCSASTAARPPSTSDPPTRPSNTSGRCWARPSHREAPGEVEVSRPSDALAAKNAADQAFTGLLVGLGSVALLVGGIGVANTMIISVLERRREIGLRRSLGATRRHILVQFLVEALLLSALGGVAGCGLGAAVTATMALTNDWPFALPPATLGIAVAATLVIGAVAGLYPALRAARTPPTAALNS